MMKYLSKLNITEKIAYWRILDAIWKYNTCTYIPTCLSDEELKNVYYSINYDRPELFYVDFSSIACYRTSSKASVNISYKMNLEEKNKATEELNELIKDILIKATIDTTDSDFEKCKKIHNYMITNFQYDFEASKNSTYYPEAYEAFGTLKYKKGVCEGLSKAFLLIARSCGLDTFLVVGRALSEDESSILKHSWNVVNINGSYSHIDITWDCNLSNKSKLKRYDYFCIPDYWIKKDHQFEPIVECTTIKYSYFFRKNYIANSPKEMKSIVLDIVNNKKNKKVIYFKVDNVESTSNIIEKINTYVNSVIIKYIKAGYLIFCLNNPKQNIICWKIYF